MTKGQGMSIYGARMRGNGRWHQTDRGVVTGQLRRAVDAG